MKKIQTQLAEWRNKDSKLVQAEIIRLETELTKFRIGISLQKEKKTSNVGVIRKTIARLKTILQEEK